MLRRVVAIPNDWVMRSDDGGLIQVPNEHVWVESENQDARGDDSISAFGPITRKLVVGTAHSIVWPRIEPIRQVEQRAHNEYSKAGAYKPVYSRVFTDQEVFRRFGRPKYNDMEPANSEIPGWTKGM